MYIGWYPGIEILNIFITGHPKQFRWNNISELRNLEGNLVSGDESISTMVVDYYSSLYTSSGPVGIEYVV